LPEAWNLEHNRLHHYRLNEVADPDLVQNNAQWVRDMEIPTIIKQVVIVPAIAVTWKFVYYAPNTYKELKTREWIASGKALPQHYIPENAIGLIPLIAPGDDSERAMREVVNPVDFFLRVMAPFFLTRFVLLPAPLLAIPDIGPALFGHAIVNLILAEALTNVHAFCTVVTNHCGGDLYTFDDAVKPRSSSFYVRQIVGSANYATGTDTIDFCHGFLNYQIEHHVWPDLSMLQYQKAAPQLKAICEKHGVPYIQESVLERVVKTADIMVGKANMRPFPTQYEPAKDKMGRDKGLTWKSDNGSIDGDDKV
jgi:Fatty acid desaturase